jgi:hypothetical protein
MGSRRSRDSTRASHARSALPASAASLSDLGSPHNDESRPAAPRFEFPVEIQDAINRERKRLQQASAVLSCLKIASLYQAWHEEIDPGDVAEIVQTLIDKAIDRLDLVELVRSAQEPGERDATAGASTDDD